MSMVVYTLPFSNLHITIFTIRSILTNSSMLPSISKIFVRRFSYSRIARTSSAIPARNVQENAEGNAKAEVENQTKDIILQSEDYFKVRKLFTIKEMFNAGVHYGHKAESLDERMKPFIFGYRLDHVIFDLDTTAYHLTKALNFCAHVAYRDGIILFISHNKRCSLLVEDTALECKEFAYTRDWYEGLFTQSVNLFRYEVRLPDLCIMLNTNFETGQQHRAVVEANKLLIPTIAVVDSNCNPNLITYPVPGNDDSVPSVAFFCKVFKMAIMSGKEKRKEHSEAGLLTPIY